VHDLAKVVLIHRVDWSWLEAAEIGFLGFAGGCEAKDGRDLLSNATVTGCHKWGRTRGARTAHAQGSTSRLSPSHAVLDLQDFLAIYARKEKLRWLCAGGAYESSTRPTGGVALSEGTGGPSSGRCQLPAPVLPPSSTESGKHGLNSIRQQHPECKRGLALKRVRRRWHIPETQGTFVAGSPSYSKIQVCLSED